jgi:hypothetical protein
MRIAVLSDTHAPRFWKRCPDGVARNLDGVDLILHAGDLCLPSVVQELARFAPVLAVLGNNDGPDVAAAGVEPIVQLGIEGIQLAMLHDSGPATGRVRRMRTRFPGADVVVFGHSHIPWNTVDDGQRLFNPGSPTDKRRQPHRTMGMLCVDGESVRADVLELD